MSSVEEITSVFAKLASNLQPLNPTAGYDGEEDVTMSISNLNRSLNLMETPRVSVLDSALSLMCFTAPQVYEKVVEYTVKAIVTVLSSSIECKALRFGKDEVLRVGGSISVRDSGNVIEACADILERLKDRGGDHFYSLLYSLTRVAVLASDFQYAPDFSSIIDSKSIGGRRVACLKLIHHLPKESIIKTGELPLRLLYWFLDWHVLKHDVSQILQEVVRRPFLCLSVEFHENPDWLSVLTCLALSPYMFIEMRAMLHHWFLTTGIASVLKLQTELVSLLLDVSSRPMWWGFSMEIGSKLSFSQAYFPYNHQLLSILAGPLSCERLQHLVLIVKTSVSHAEGYSNSASEQAPLKIAMVDHKSMWAMAMNFPDWFYFASVLLLSDNTFHDQYHSGCVLHSAADELLYSKSSCSSAAAWFIAWIINPTNQPSNNLLVENLTNLAASWALKSIRNEATVLETNLLDEEKMNLNKYSFRKLCQWLNEYRDMCFKYCRHVHKSLTCGAVAPQQDIGNQQYLLMRKIPLGIMTGCSSYIDEQGCELLLHYAATGIMFHLEEKRPGRLKHRGPDHKRQQDSIAWTGEYTRKEAVAGASAVFDLTDLVETTLMSLFDSEEIGINLLCQFKLRAGHYLLKCVKRLLQLRIDDDAELLILSDICKRIDRWKHQGQDISQNFQGLDVVIDMLSCIPKTL